MRFGRLVIGSDPTPFALSSTLTGGVVRCA
jgi:hypothetical protein